MRTRVRLPLRGRSGDELDAEIVSFHGLADAEEHVALRLGPPVADGRVPLVRIHSECLTGDVFGSLRCDCGPQLEEAVERIGAAGGWILYLRQEGRGIGLYAKLDAYGLQDHGLDTFAANRAIGRRDDEREYTVAAQMLRALGVGRVDLLSNNPDKAEQLERLGVEVRRRVPTAVHLSDANHRYLEAKVAQRAHTIDLPVRHER